MDLHDKPILKIDISQQEDILSPFLKTYQMINRSQFLKEDDLPQFRDDELQSKQWSKAFKTRALF